MIVDAHTHIWDRAWMPEWYWDSVGSMMARRLGISVEEAKARMSANFDPRGDHMVASMDVAGIDKVMICNLDYGLVDYQGDAELPPEETNRLHFEATKRHVGRLVMAVGVDPRRKNAAQIVEKGIVEYGAKALKLHPATGYYPNDRMVYPLYEICSHYGVPVDFHTGPHPPPLRSKFVQPILYDDVALDFPDLTIIATHAGHGSYQEMLAIARAKPNIVCDLAGWQSWLAFPVRFYETLRMMLDFLGSERLMFATDMVNGGDAAAWSRWLKAFTDIPDSVKEAGIQFTEREIADIVGGTAARVLKIEG